MFHKLFIFPNPALCRIVPVKSLEDARPCPTRKNPQRPPRRRPHPRRSPGFPVRPSPEVQEGLHTRFARLFFGVITLLVLYFSYLIIKPYLINVFMALVLFFTAKPLYMALNRSSAGNKVLASGLTCIILLP